MGDSGSTDDPLDALAGEFVERRRRGERCTATEYARLYPGQAEAILERFAALERPADQGPAGGDEVEATLGAPAGGDGPPREELGDFRIIRQVGRGGMGIVYEAEQVSLGRRVALKVLPRAALLAPRQVERFRREARAAARLHHTNIVPVFGVGECDGLHFYVMQFIVGRGLDEILAERRRPGQRPDADAATATAAPADDEPSRGLGGDPTPLPTTLARRLEQSGERSGVSSRRADAPASELASDVTRAGSGAAAQVLSHQGPAAAGPPGRRAADSSLDSPGRRRFHNAARIGMDVAEALAYAAAQGILHRDIKPSNLLLDTDGTIWVADFGLAKALDDDASLTETGDVVGTLRYMAPERLRGGGDVRSDICSLGLTLYELLVLRPAYPESDRHKLIVDILGREPEPPRSIDPAIPRDLETIVLKATARDPDRRYADAGELAEDLRRFLDGRPIAARPIGPVGRAWRWCRRNRAMAGLGALVLVLLFSMAVGGTWAAVHFHSQLEAIRRSEAGRHRALAESVLTARPESVPLIVDDLRSARGSTIPILRRVLDDPSTDPAVRLRAAVVLTMLGDDRTPIVIEQIPTAAPASGREILSALAASGGSSVGRLREGFKAAGNLEVRSRFAIALLQFGEPDAARSMLALDADQSDRAAFIHHFADWHGDLARLAEILRRARDPVLRAGLCTAMGRIPRDRLHGSERRTLEPVLRDFSLDDPDAALHSAAGWLLRRWKIGLPAIAAGRRALAGRAWFVNELGLTMVEPPVGPLPGGDAIILPFWMSTTEITVAQFRRFLEDRTVLLRDRAYGLSIPADVDGDLPMSGLCFVDAALFCNWLSAREGRTPCYRRAPGTEDGWLCRFDADGYRLPTRVEWDYAAWAGARTTYTVGEAADFIDDYANIVGIRPEPVARRCPNGWGFFDLVGNVWDLAWAADPGAPVPPFFPLGESEGPGGAQIAGSTVVGGTHMTRRGEAGKVAIRSRGDYGFRVVCGEGNLSNRLARLKDRIERHGDADLVTAYGRALDRAGDRAAAIAAFREATRRDPGSWNAWGWLGGLLLRAGRPGEAIEAIRRSIALKPDVGQNYRVLAWSEAALGRRDEAIAAYRELIRRRLAGESDILGLAAAIEAVGRPGDVAGLTADLKAAGNSGPSLAIIWRYLVWSVVKSPGAEPDAVAGAVELARKAVAEGPGADAALGRCALGAALYRTGDLDGAIAELEESVRILGDRGYARNGFVLAMALWRKGKAERALMTYDRALAWMEGQYLDDRELRGLRAEAEALLDLRRPRPGFRSALGDFDTRWYYEAGERLARHRRWPAALDAFRRAAARGRRAFAAAGLGQLYTHAWQAQGEILLALNDRPGYEALCARWLDLQAAAPGDFASGTDAERIAKTCALAPLAGRRDAARIRHLAEEAMRRDGGRHNSLLTQTLVAFRAGRHEEVRRRLQEHLMHRSDPVGEVVSRLIASLNFEAMGRHREARMMLATALRRQAETATPPAPDLGGSWWFEQIKDILVREAVSIIPLDPIFPADPFTRPIAADGRQEPVPAGQ